ncbi:hypothetical protein ID866_8032 [Astraeus odoratus]|nr:hypothetical protein ID866_8032 [Astraeus odoratus]
MTPVAIPTPLTKRKEKIHEEEQTPSLYDLKDVKAEIEELEHLKKGKTSESTEHEMRTAPLITREAFIAGGFQARTTQYGVLGETLSIHSKSGEYIPVDPRLYVNTNAPLSAVVCGVQGSGKSHTVSVLLENMFIDGQDSMGCLYQPLSGLVLHFGEGGTGARPSEAAWVGSTSRPGVEPPRVYVYVSRSSLNTMRAVYAPLGERVKVMPLLFNESELDAQAILSMMAVGSSESAPLYIQIVLSILRELGERFSYKAFLTRLEAEKRNFNPAQAAGLEQRLALLNSFMEPPSKGHGRGHSSEKHTTHRFASERLTVVDLSDPFIDPASACGLFEIVTRQFVRADIDTGKVLVVDEAHKAAWWDHLARHVATDVSADQGFETVVKLQTGEAVVFAPSGLGVFPDDAALAKASGIVDAGKDRVKVPLKLGQFGRRFLLMKTRARLTKDGGSSVLVV